jgi:hypothetical protein
MGYYAGVPTDDKELDARRNERLSWNRVVETLTALADTPLSHADLPRRRYETAKNAWGRAWRQLCRVSP